MVKIDYHDKNYLFNVNFGHAAALCTLIVILSSYVLRAVHLV